MEDRHAALVYALESTDPHSTVSDGRKLTATNLASESRGHFGITVDGTGMSRGLTTGTKLIIMTLYYLSMEL
jgi:hypothetical protein